VRLRGSWVRIEDGCVCRVFMSKSIASCLLYQTPAKVHLVRMYDLFFVSRPMGIVVNFECLLDILKLHVVLVGLCIGINSRGDTG
jgi:hypothetical protein